MQLSLAFTAIICFVEHATLVQGVRRIVPKDILDISRAYHHSSSVDINLRRDAHNIVDHALHQERNVVRPSDAAFPSSKISSRAIAAATEEKNTWNSTTEAACLKALKATETNTKNLAGLAGCYNIKYFNSSSGVFQADLRLYRTAPASGDWSTADSQSYQISLSCDGASVATDSARLIKRQDEMLSWPPVRRSTLAKTYFRRSATAPPKMVQQMNFAGMINETLMGKINDV